jgi:hypothetical protein
VEPQQWRQAHTRQRDQDPQRQRRLEEERAPQEMTGNAMVDEEGIAAMQVENESEVGLVDAGERGLEKAGAGAAVGGAIGATGIREGSVYASATNAGKGEHAMNRRALERGLSSQGAKVGGTGNNIGVADTRTSEIATFGGVGNASARRQRRPPRVLFFVSEPGRMHEWGEYGEETLVASILREKSAGQGQQHDGQGSADGRRGCGWR